MLESCGSLNSPNLSTSVFLGCKWSRWKFVNPNTVSLSFWRLLSFRDHMFLVLGSKTSTMSSKKSVNSSCLSKISHSLESNVILRMKISTLIKWRFPEKKTKWILSIQAMKTCMSDLFKTLMRYRKRVHKRLTTTKSKWTRISD